MRLEEQHPPANLVWPYLVRVINGGLDWGNLNVLQTSGVTPYVVPGYYGGAIVTRQGSTGQVTVMSHVDGLEVSSTPPGVEVHVIAWR